MSGLKIPLFNNIQSVNRRMRDNAHAISEYNATQLPSSILIACAILVVPLLMSLFIPRMRQTSPGYVAAFAGCALLYFVFRKKERREYALAGFYLLYAVIYLLSLYLSLIRYPDRPAASMLTFIFVMPILFIDKPLRLYTTVAALYIVHTALSYAVKGPELGSIDIVNCFISAALGILISRTMHLSRLETFEARRQLTLEKETDVLTGLLNRRKLFETLAQLRSGELARPDCVLMLDIDHFKRFNDRFGHGAGDACLGRFGLLLLEFQQKYTGRFFRYGGEEFVVFLWNCDRERLSAFAESLREAAEQMDAFARRITVSIGTVSCDDASVINYETWIDRADKAAYAAKALGRNAVACWNDMQQSSAAPRTSPDAFAQQA